VILVYSHRLVLDDELIEPVPPSPPHEEVEPVQELITMPSRFESVQEKGYIDVWWLYDDGGGRKCDITFVL